MGSERNGDVYYLLISLVKETGSELGVSQIQETGDVNLMTVSDDLGFLQDTIASVIQEQVVGIVTTPGTRIVEGGLIVILVFFCHWQGCQNKRVCVIVAQLPESRVAHIPDACRD